MHKCYSNLSINSLQIWGMLIMYYNFKFGEGFQINVILQFAEIKTVNITNF